MSNAIVRDAIDPALYTVEDMMRLLGRSSRWVRGHQSRLPGYTRAFGGVRFVRSAVDAYLQAIAGGSGLSYVR